MKILFQKKKIYDKNSFTYKTKVYFLKSKFRFRVATGNWSFFEKAKNGKIRRIWLSSILPQAKDPSRYTICDLREGEEGGRMPGEVEGEQVRTIGVGAGQIFFGFESIWIVLLLDLGRVGSDSTPKIWIFLHFREKE